MQRSCIQGFKLLPERANAFSGFEGAAKKPQTKSLYILKFCGGRSKLVKVNILEDPYLVYGNDRNVPRNISPSAFFTQGRGLAGSGDDPNPLLGGRIAGRS
jgi:hypothetical protein